LPDPRLDGHHQADARRLGAVQYPVQLAPELGKIEVAMAVDQHEITQNS
jgi:hypothetical protein